MPIILRKQHCVRTLVIFIWLALTSFACAKHAMASVSDKFKHPFYVGVTGGYGKTTWEGLVSKSESAALLLSSPMYVNEGGALWGLFAGYEFFPYFALEAAYMRYPNARVMFDSSSLYTFESGNTEFTTKTETVSLLAKLMIFIPTTEIRVYSGLGVAEVHRSDSLNTHWTGRPTFGAGANYLFTDRVMGELGGSYTAGNGEVQLNPSQSYFPFLYSVFLRVAYRF